MGRNRRVGLPRETLSRVAHTLPVDAGMWLHSRTGSVGSVLHATAMRETLIFPRMLRQRHGGANGLKPMSHYRFRCFGRGR